MFINKRKYCGTKYLWNVRGSYIHELINVILHTSNCSDKSVWTWGGLTSYIF